MHLSWQFTLTFASGEEILASASFDSATVSVFGPPSGGASTTPNNVL